MGIPLNTNVAESGGSWASAPGSAHDARTPAAAKSRAQISATGRHDRMDDMMPPSGGASVGSSVRSQVGHLHPPSGMVSAHEAAVNPERRGTMNPQNAAPPPSSSGPDRCATAAKCRSDSNGQKASTLEESSRPVDRVYPLIRGGFLIVVLAFDDDPLFEACTGSDEG